MIKHGKVIPGKTPSVVSGKPSDSVKEGEPVCDGEKPADPGLKKTASEINKLFGYYDDGVLHRPLDAD
jgi:hypothetical protein